MFGRKNIRKCLSISENKCLIEVFRGKNLTQKFEILRGTILPYFLSAGDPTDFYQSETGNKSPFPHNCKGAWEEKINIDPEIS